MEFIVGHDLEEFETYYKTLSSLNDYYINHGWREPGPMELGEDERNHIERDPSHLIIWMKDDQIMGHTIWHETSTEEMIPGSQRTDSDRNTLHKLLGGSNENLVELHEIWLRPEHRGKRYGQRFFEFFERFAHDRGFEGIVYYATDTAAMSICRRRGYKEAHMENEGLCVFTKMFNS